MNRDAPPLGGIRNPISPELFPSIIAYVVWVLSSNISRADLSAADIKPADDSDAVECVWSLSALSDNLLSIFGKTDIPDINTVWNKLKNKYCIGELLWRFLLEGFDEDDIKQTPELESYKPPYESWQYFRENVIDKNLYTTCGTLGQYKAMYD